MSHQIKLAVKLFLIYCDDHRLVILIVLSLFLDILIIYAFLLC